MRMLIAAACLLAWSGWLFSGASFNDLQAQTLSAPQQTTDEEIKADDGTTEGAPVGQANVLIVNRLTPSRYPATLKAIRIFFRQVNPTPVGQQIRLVAFARTPSSTAAPSNPTYLVNQTVTIPPVSTTGEFVDFAIQNGPTITAGDFFAGFQQSGAAGVPFFWYDGNEPLANRGYASVDNGANYAGNIRVGSETGPFINFMLRALVTVPGALATVSAASFAAGDLASDAIGAAFGVNLATGTTAAASLPLPTTLGGVSVRVRDNAGTERLAPLFFVSTGQINLLLPTGASSGLATLTVTNASGTVATGTLNIAAVAPGLFTVASNGSGFPAALALRVKPDQSTTFTLVAQFDTAQNRFVAVPIDFGEANDRTFLILYGTGVRGRSDLSNVRVRIGGIEAPTSYAGPVGGLAGLDQINVELPRSLAGRGEVDVVLLVDGKTANTVKVNFK